ncbi:hypothetical protein HGG71_04535 [Rhodobacteraceae bacterium R_SAG2]|jgi:alkylated DNA nucleotide flippase Atl1|nr:hypothetical protein [Rhodobacteraceae bacterium R_SAG2]
MPSKSRFIKSIVAAAKSEEIELPWSRGANRQAMIERRQQDRTATQQAKTA